MDKEQADYFLSNMTKMSKWYEEQPPLPCPDVYSMAAISLRDTSLAFALAMDRKEWKPPQPQ